MAPMAPNRSRFLLIAGALLAASFAFMLWGLWRPPSVSQGHSGWYVHPLNNRFQALGVKYKTDKVARHNYQTVYARAFELQPGRGRTHKLLEIGLGCNMDYGPGHSAQIWREYLPHAEIWMGEYDVACVEKYKKNLDKMGIKVVTGDQADIQTLQRWVGETRGGFDVIIDDGGHSNMQMFNSFMILFDKALKPGGLYVIEDMNCARLPGFIDGDKEHIMIDVVKEWIDDLVMSPDEGGKIAMRYPRPQSIKSIQCSSHACSFVKRYADDPYSA